jgi:hypothetical protein
MIYMHIYLGIAIYTLCIYLSYIYTVLDLYPANQATWSGISYLHM